MDFFQSPNNFAPCATPARSFDWTGPTIAAYHRLSEMCTKYVAVVAVLLGQMGLALALEPDRELGQYVRNTWTVDRGLPQSTVFGVSQTPDGYIWIATQEGFVRFDGTEFVTYDAKSHPVISSDLGQCMRVTRDGTLYVGTIDGGLISMHGETIEVFNETNGLPGNFVTTLFESRDGTLWIGTKNGLARLVDHRVSQFPSHELPSPAITAIAEDASGSLWVATDRGIVTITAGEIRLRTEKEGFPTEKVAAIIGARDGSVWIASEVAGLFRFHNGSIANYREKDGLPTLRVTAVFEDRFGVIWIGTNDGGFGRLHGTRFEFESESRTPVISFFQDRDGNLWIGRMGGLDQLSDGVITTWSKSEGLLDDDIKSVTAQRDGTIWVGTRLGVTDLSGNRRWTEREGLSSSYILTTLAARDGSLWIGTATAGLNHVRADGITKYTTADGLPGDSILAIFEDSRGILWVGTEAGLGRIVQGQVEPRGPHRSLPPDSVSVIAESRDGAIWVGTHDSGVARIRRDGTVDRLNQRNGLSSNFVLAVHDDGTGTIWIGTVSGFNRFRNGRFVSIKTRQGLPDDAVFGILQDASSNLWMSCNKGIFRASLANLNAVADRRAPRVVSVLYGRSDGMKSRECNGGTYPVAWQAPDGTMLFATTFGLATIHPDRAIRGAAPSPVQVSAIYADGVNLRGTEIPPDSRTLEFHYTTTTFKTPDKLRFRYRLEGFDKDWIDAQARRIAYYTNVPPGHYRFRVQVFDGEGVPGREAALLIRVKPLFYQTFIFWAFVAITILAALWAAHLWRVRMVRASAERFKVLFDRNLAGVYRARVDGRILDCNTACLGILGVASREELSNRSIFDFYANSGEAEAVVRRLHEEGAVSGVETALRRSDGRPMWVLQNINLAKENGQEILEATVIDLSDRKEAEEKIRYLAYHDGLTGLPNRALFKDRLALAVAHAERRGRKAAVLFLDLDRFKLINDTLGHTIGDHLLQGLAERLKQCVREEDSVARVGGDEFTILLMDLGRPADAMVVAQKILDAVARPMTVDGHELYTTCSIGIAMSPNDGVDAETLLKNADNALYRAKEAGKNNYQLCTPSMTQFAAERLAVESALRQALDRHEFRVHYQPQYDLKAKRIVGVEALLRWDRPGTGIVGPADFIDAAEESRLIVPIGEVVLDAALEQAQRWGGEHPVRVAVNVSAAQFRQRHLVRTVRNALEEYGIDPTRLEIEITESTAMQNPAITAEILHELKALGVSVVIDDFGIGHSSLNYLKRFPIDGLKIDRTFVQDMIQDTSDAGIVSAVIAMAHALNLRVVAEGVETEEQLRFLERRGCSSIQGFLLSRPVDAEVMTNMLRAAPPVLGSTLPHTA